jgi:hypothetical protein
VSGGNPEWSVTSATSEMAAPVTIVLGTITIASRLMVWSDAIRALASNAMRRRFVRERITTDKPKPMLNEIHCARHGIRLRATA